MLKQVVNFRNNKFKSFTIITRSARVKQKLGSVQASQSELLIELLNDAVYLGR